MEARKSNSAVATEKNIKKEKWLIENRCLKSADLSVADIVF